MGGPKDCRDPLWFYHLGCSSATFFGCTSRGSLAPIKTVTYVVLVLVSPHSNFLSWESQRSWFSFGTVWLAQQLHGRIQSNFEKTHFRLSDFLKFARKFRSVRPGPCSIFVIAWTVPVLYNVQLTGYEIRQLFWKLVTTMMLLLVMEGCCLPNWSVRGGSGFMEVRMRRCLNYRVQNFLFKGYATSTHFGRLLLINSTIFCKLMYSMHEFGNSFKYDIWEKATVCALEPYVLRASITWITTALELSKAVFNFEKNQIWFYLSKMIKYFYCRQDEVSCCWRFSVFLVSS